MILSHRMDMIQQVYTKGPVRVSPLEKAHRLATTSNKLFNFNVVHMNHYVPTVRYARCIVLLLEEM